MGGKFRDVLGDIAELDVQGARDVPGCVLVVLADVENRPIEPDRVDQLRGGDRETCGSPCVDAAGDGAGELVVADGARLADEVRGVLREGPPTSGPRETAG